MSAGALSNARNAAVASDNPSPATVGVGGAICSGIFGYVEIIAGVALRKFAEQGALSFIGGLCQFRGAVDIGVGSALLTSYLLEKGVKDDLLGENCKTWVKAAKVVIPMLVGAAVAFTLIAGYLSPINYTFTVLHVLSYTLPLNVSLVGAAWTFLQAPLAVNEVRTAMGR